mmetsp:Transcript_28062/g.95650  ORF Transcript_28062/g.95650 Transcript_28062/m.95650 type:complete len:99 (-) Transcript_28062:1599-1895(-)
MAAKQEKEDRQQRQAGSYMLIARLLASQRERDTMQHTHDSFDGPIRRIIRIIQGYPERIAQPSGIFLSARISDVVWWYGWNRNRIPRRQFWAEHATKP